MNENSKSPSSVVGNSIDVLAVAKALRETSVALEAVIVFGSVARGSATADSDFDAAVIADHALDAYEKIELIEALAAVTGRPIDLVDLRTVGEPLLGEILRDGVAIQGVERVMTTLVLRHLYADADFVPLQRRILAERRQKWIGV